MHEVAIPFGGGVPHKGICRLKGQSIIEYVLIAAIIGLVAIFAGPQVVGAIRSQFDTVAGVIGSGASKGSWDSESIPDPQNGPAFAVYSEDDHSLMFYKRRGVPKVGDMFNDRRVTEVYTGFETASYEPSWSDTGNYIPWAAVAGEVLSAKVIDCGIAPVSIAHWFDFFYNMRICNLEKLVARNIGSMNGTFYQDWSLSSLVLPASSFESLVSMESTFRGCASLAHLDFNELNVAHVSYFDYTFASCKILTLDCSDWNVSARASHDSFNEFAPAVIAPKAWQ